MSQHRAEMNQGEFAQMAKFREEADGYQKERGQSARDQIKQQQRELKSSEVSSGSSRYAQLLSNNTKALSGRAKRLSPSGKHVGIFMSNTPDHGYATQKKQTISPNSIRKNLSNQQRQDLQHGQQQRSINNLRQNLMAGKQSSQNSRDMQRRNDAGSQQMMRQLCLEEQIMDLEEKSHSGTILDHEKTQGKKNRSRNYQLEIRTDPKLEPRSVQIELMNSGGTPASGSAFQQSSINNNQKQQKNKGFMKTHQQLVPSLKSLSSPGSGRQVPLSSTKHVPSSNIFQLGTKGSKQKFNPKSTISDADLMGHKSQASNSSLQWQPQTALKMPTQQDGPTKKFPQTQVQNNYFVKQSEQEQSKEPSSKSKKKNMANHLAQKDLNNLQSDTPQDQDRMSTSENVFDDTRNNGLNKAAIQDSSQHTQYLSTAGNQLHFIHTPASLDTPELFHPGKNLKDYPMHPYGGAPTPSNNTYQALDTQGANNPQTPLNNTGLIMHASPAQESSKFSATHSSLFNRQLPKGSAIHYLVKEIPPHNCDLCSLQRGLQEIDKALKEREDRLAKEADTINNVSRFDQQNYQSQKPFIQGKPLGYKLPNSRLVKKKEEFREQREPEPDWGSIAIEPVRLSASKFMIKEVLSSKYLKCDDYFNCKLTSDIMYNETRHIVSVFKDYLIYDDFSEYMKRFYRLDEATERLPRIFSFYAKYSKVYPNYVALPRESRFMFKNIERKQKLIDQRNRRMQEVQEKKVAAEKGGGKDLEALQSDKVGEMSDSKSLARFNLFNSEFVNNLTDHEFLKHKQSLVNFEENIQETLGYDGPQGSDHHTDNKFQVYQASAGNRDQTQRSQVDPANFTNRLSQLLMDISMVSKADQSLLPSKSQVEMLNRGASSKMSHQFLKSQEPVLLEHSLHPRPESQPFAQVPSISCSFISNHQSASKVVGSRETIQGPPGFINYAMKGFDLNATSGDSLKQHFKNEENMAEITSILYTDPNTNDDKRKLTLGPDDDEAEFAVPSEKDDEIVSIAEPPHEKKKHSNQKSGRKEIINTQMKQKQSSNNLPGSNEQSAKRNKNLKSSSKEKNKNSDSQQFSPHGGNKNSGSKSHRDEMRCVTKSTQSIIGQAMKNQELLYQAQRASMLKHAVQEVERDAQQRHMAPDLDLPLPAIATEGHNEDEDCIDDEFERNVGQTEDFQNFLSKYMQQKLRQAEQKVKDNFLEVQQCEYGSSPQLSQGQQQAQAQATANKLVSSKSVLKPYNSRGQQRSKSGERSGSLIKSRSYKKTFVKPSKYTPSGIGGPDQAQASHHPFRSASDATLMKDVSTGQLLKKLNSNYVPIERIYGVNDQTKKSRKTLSTPKHRPSVNKKLTRTGSRSSRAEERLAQLGFQKYPASKKQQSYKQSKMDDQDGDVDDDDELPSVDDEYQGLGKNMQERQHQNHQALQREASNRKVPSVLESPGSRLDRNSQMRLQLPLHQIAVNTTGNMPSPNSDGKNKTLDRPEGREQQAPKVAMKTKKLSEMQMLGHGNLKNPSRSTLNKNDGIQIPNIAQMKLASNPSSIKSSILQTKPNSNRKLYRKESPGSTKINNIGGYNPQRDKISVYPTQRVQTMKGAGDSHIKKNNHGGIYASTEMYLNTDRPSMQKQPMDKINQGYSRKPNNRGIQTVPGSTKHAEKMGSHNAFGPQSNKGVKTDRASSAQMKIPGSTINLKVDGNSQQEYNNPIDGIRVQTGPTHSIKERVGSKQSRTGVTSPYMAQQQITRKRGSAAATLKSYRPNSLTDSARGTSSNSGPGIYAKMIRAQAQTSVKQRQIASSSSSRQANYTTRTKQQSAQQIRTGSNRPDSVSSQKDNKIQQFRTKSGLLASASLLSPSLLQGQQQSSLPSQKIIGNRPFDAKQQRTSSRGTAITNQGGLKKQSVKTINSGKSFGQQSKRLSKKQTIFSVNTSEQR